MDSDLSTKNRKQHSVYIPYDEMEKYEELRWQKRYTSLSEMLLDLIRKGYEQTLKEEKGESKR